MTDGLASQVRPPDPLGVTVTDVEFSAPPVTCKSKLDPAAAVVQAPFTLPTTPTIVQEKPPAIVNVSAFALAEVGVPVPDKPESLDAFVPEEWVGAVPPQLTGVQVPA